MEQIQTQWGERVNVVAVAVAVSQSQRRVKRHAEDQGASLPLPMGWKGRGRPGLRSPGHVGGHRPRRERKSGVHRVRQGPGFGEGDIGPREMRWGPATSPPSDSGVTRSMAAFRASYGHAGPPD